VAPLHKVSPFAAVLSALAVFACCVPLGIVGAFGFMTIGAFFEAAQPWFLAISIALLAIAIGQAYFGRQRCRTRVSRFSLAVLGLSALLVLSVVFFPQVVAGLLADYVL
jgi:hypothetical protein